MNEQTMSYSINFDNHELSDYIRVVTVRRNIGVNRTNNTVKSGNRTGQRFTSVTRDMATIEVDFKIRNNIMSKRRELAAILNVVEPATLILGDEPDKYYVASPDGEIALTEQTFLGTGTLRFLVPGGVAHAINSRNFPFLEDEATVQNDGTSEAPLDIYIKFTSDTNAIGIASEDDVVQLGSGVIEDEADFVASNKVLNDGMGTSQKGQWSVNTGRPRFKYDYGDGSSRVMGSVKWEDSKVVVSSFGTIGKDDPGYWHGPTLVRSVGTPLENAELYHRFKLKPTGATKNRKKAQGLLEINYLDLDGNFVMGFSLKDNNPNKAAIMYDFFIGDKRVYRGNIPKKVLNYTQGIFGYIDMKKVGNKFTFKVCHLYNDRENWSATKTFYNESIANLSIATINFFGAQWKRVQSMATEWTHTRITKINTEDDSLVPLTFYEGDDLYVDGTSNRVYINGIRNDNYRVIGSSQILEAPLGESNYSVLTDGTYEGYLAMREEFV